MDQFDVVVIGGGPGGYVAAIRAAQLGLSVACVEKRDSLGGTCLNVGCIPSKALLTSSEKWVEATGHLASHGVKVGEVTFDLGAMMAHKDKVVAANTAGIAFLFRKHKITWVKGHGRLVAADRVEVTGDAPARTLIASKAIVIATGSEVQPLPGVEIDEHKIVSSTGALTLTEVPRRLAVIGGGYIGLELGSVWARLGSQVTVIEFLDRILPGMDRDVSKTMHRLLGRQGLTFRLGTKVTAAGREGDGVRLTLTPAAGDGAAETLDADLVLVAIGRRPHVAGLGLDAVGVALTGRGRIRTDQNLRTSVPGIYAIGDVIDGPMLAHKAEEDGVAVAEVIAGQSAHLDYGGVPGVVYTAPEAAQVGRTEEGLRDAGVAIKVGSFPFTANGRARALAQTDGFVKLIADARTDRLLGAHIVGAEAGTMVAELALAMAFGASAEDIARTSHAHPTLNEAVKEAALAVADRALHM